MVNRKSNLTWGLIALVMALLLTGCGGNAKDDQDGAANGTSVETGGVAGEGGIGGEQLGADGRPTTLRIHFEFDSAKVSDDSRITLEAHASYLSANPDIKLKLEGHTDERGTREYNLALGERRANSAAKLLKVLGVDGARIETTSYGEEKPVDENHDDTAWSQNRRVEIIYSDS